MKSIWIGLAAYLWAAVAWGQTTVHFVIDANRDVHPISRFIYGVNQPIGSQWKNATFVRFGGNRTTAYNWVTNASNAGSDWHYSNDDYLAKGDVPGAAVLPTLRNAFEQQAGALITVPTNGYVSADENGPVDIHDPNRFATRFKREMAAKGKAFDLHPSANEPVVYQDEFVNWVKANCPHGLTDMASPIYFELDNEPDIWAETHPEVHPDKVTYAEMVKKTIEYATAIKHMEPGVLVYGPVNFGWSGIATLQNAPDANGRDFEAYYLNEISHASEAAHRRLLDVLDIHWYPEATGGGKRITEADHTPEIVAARLQAPRSLLDANYLETSWITKDSTHGPIRLIPRLMDIIAKNYPGTKLSISEYNYGGPADISGAIAEADVLGIFGKYGVFSANEWPLLDREPMIAAGFGMFRNFDGNNGIFGDTSIFATTDDVADTSVYASVDSADAHRIVIIAINKSDHPINTDLQIRNGGTSIAGKLYQLLASDLKPTYRGDLRGTEPDRLQLTMPAYSVSTFVAVR